MSSEQACPAPESPLLPELVDGALTSEAAERVEAHLFGCPVCQAELAGLRAFGRAIEASHLSSDEIVAAGWGEEAQGESHLPHCARCREEVEAVRSARPADAAAKEGMLPSRAPARWWPAAAAAVLAVGLGLAYFQMQSPGTVAEPASATRGLPSIGQLEPAGPLPRSSGDLVFTWNGPSDRGYRVSFLTVDGRLIHVAEVADRRLALGPAERELLAREMEFFWRVEALSNGGAVPAEQVARVSWQP